MIYSNTAELTALLKREKLWAQKKLGQNFLVNPQALENIIKAAELTKEDHVVEIGPGLGILTEQLALNAKNVTAVEFDRTIIPVLQKNLRANGIGNVFIVNADALKTELPTAPYKLVANIPYYITSPLLTHFLQPKTPRGASETPPAGRTSDDKITPASRAPDSGIKSIVPLRPSLLVLLVQKEVAQKICVKDGDQTILSLQVQAFGKPSIVCDVGRNSFFPQPNVDSAVIKIKTYDQPRISDIGVFLTMIKGAFSQKRKKISNTLPHALGLTPAQEEQLFSISKISPDERAQNISLEGWEALIQAYLKIIK
jgi:16S rRNA (adenine1518-N6/adenine1519-N6)-dimethyltransferase